ncbi:MULTISPECIES: type II toxin-antitoxin system RelE/ParE family toxin [Paraburkholderia]|uniref:mRNA interferase RelE/StbE n=1 Tax=Paraburkholderia megapolitana TaxID=420953 RepID=A0A1I3NR67_9BURK|nr:MULTISPECIES: type II toxin-antitoxin system RelE/ParE family toxin [Paraburkholderia]MCX4162245.1 type II toxin-antitoxin system RelE/ParE family toxin [Paraburkholderia megapolitana]MDN7157740.1 type II toxin-antitoxin system RelE/ParE family toxin [Paraburkholderia sp. CHISQ3]MDQ6494787.1 type II toxin-antitoxin system RelE/ParE family toxin [Paraburkholderia megapolitana]QDQ84463.1 type II toxin-antitoxin system RelE/ParE family toxin [Paraburkholderia megapolitana]SFJ11470.1 mRNA inter
MPYELDFAESAAREWGKLDSTVKRQFAKKPTERLENPHVPSSRLHDMKDCYKIKLRASGYRLVYRVEDRTVTVFVIAVGKREKNRVYVDAQDR